MRVSRHMCIVLAIVCTEYGFPGLRRSEQTVTFGEQGTCVLPGSDLVVPRSDIVVVVAAGRILCWMNVWCGGVKVSGQTIARFLLVLNAVVMKFASNILALTWIQLTRSSPRRKLQRFQSWSPFSSSTKQTLLSWSDPVFAVTWPSSLWDDGTS